VLPVPLSPERLAERGHEPGLGAGAADRRRARHRGARRLLWPLVDTPHLADLPRATALPRIRGAFGIAPARRTACAVAAWPWWTT
jgi:hypothetical protein